MLARTNDHKIVGEAPGFCAPVTYPRCDWMARFLRFKCAELATVQEHLRSLDASICLSVANPRGFRCYTESLHVAVGSLALTVGCIDSADGYELAFQSRDEYVLNMPLSGSGRVRAGGVVLDMDSHDVLLIAPCCRVVKHWRGPGRVVSLHMPRQAMHRALRDRGMSPRALCPDSATVFARQQIASFLRLINTICGELEDGGKPLREMVIADQYERLMMSLLIDGLPGKAIDMQQRATPCAAPHYIQRAEDYVRANALDSMNTRDIAAAAGVSTRALQYGFRRYRQLTPTLFLKQVRLERARTLLRGFCGGRPPRVSDVAADIGCFNTSQFSRDYKAMFGETPTQTVTAQKMLAAGAMLMPSSAAPDLASRQSEVMA